MPSAPQSTLPPRTRPLQLPCALHGPPPASAPARALLGPRSSGLRPGCPPWPVRCLPCPSHPAALTGSALGSEVTGFRECGDRGQGAGCGGHAVPFQGKPAGGVGEERAGAAEGPRALGGWCEQQGPWQREPVSQGRVGHRGAPRLPCCHVGPSVRAFRGRCLCPNGAEPWGAQHSHGAGAHSRRCLQSSNPISHGQSSPPPLPLPRET